MLAGERKKVVVVLSVLADGRDGRTKAVDVLPEAEISCKTPFKVSVFIFSFWFSSCTWISVASAILAETKFFQKLKKTKQKTNIKLYNTWEV